MDGKEIGTREDRGGAEKYQIPVVVSYKCHSGTVAGRCTGGTAVRVQ